VRRTRGSDPRRRARVLDPLAAFERNDPCWCMSGRKYKDCHMIRGLSTPGAATPPDTDEVVYISPNTSLRLDGVTVPQAPVPITMQGPVPQAVPVTVDEAVTGPRLWCQGL